MKRCKFSSWPITTAVLAASVIAVAGGVFAQSVTVDQVLQAGQRRLNLAQESQERINQGVERERSLAEQ